MKFLQESGLAEMIGCPGSGSDNDRAQCRNPEIFAV